MQHQASSPYEICGLATPIVKGRRSEYLLFRDCLKWIAAEECEECVNEFLELIGEMADDELSSALDANAEKIEALSERYRSTADLPAELLKDYLKEKKKLQKAS